MEKDRERCKRVMIAIEPSLHRHFRGLALANNVSFSQLIRRALTEYERTHFSGAASSISRTADK
jgi:predicted HicB family RNase H-like nuclease